MEIYIVEDDVTVISILEDIIEDNELGPSAVRQRAVLPMWMKFWRWSRM